MHEEGERQAAMMLGLTPDGFVQRDHPLPRIKPLVDSVLSGMSPLFDEIYAAGGRPAIPLEHLLKSSLLMAFCMVRFGAPVLRAAAEGRCGARVAERGGKTGAPPAAFRRSLHR